MLKFQDGKFKFYQYIVTYYDRGEQKTEYTDTPSLYSDMVNNYKDLTNFSSTSLVATEEQVSRLAEVNKLAAKATMPEGFIDKVNTFVEKGYVDNNCPDWMKSLVKKHTETSKAVLIAKLYSRLSAMKTEKEYGGMTYGNHVMATDLESQSKISSVMLGFTAGMITETQFKFKDGFEVLDQAAFAQVAGYLMAHVQSCFTAESLAKDSLAKLNLDELVSYDKDSVSREAMFETTEVEDKLKTLFETNYTATMEAYAATASMK